MTKMKKRGHFRCRYCGIGSFGKLGFVILGCVGILEF